MRKYTIVESAPYCCVAASLESILKRHGFNDVSQYDIANYVGVVVNEQNSDDVPLRLFNVTYTTEHTKVGMHLYKDTLNDLFKHFGLPFQEFYISWQELSEWNIDSILQSLSDGDDAIFLFDFGHLYHEDKNIGIGHSGLFVSIDNNSIIQYLSPGPRFVGFAEFTSEDMLYAIKARQGGISIIYSVSTQIRAQF